MLGTMAYSGRGQMRRRDFSAWLGGVAAGWPSALRAQQTGRVQRVGSPLVGYLSGSSVVSTSKLVNAFRAGLAETRYVEGRNIAIDFRSAEGRYDRLETFVRELLDKGVAALAAMGATQALVAKRLTSNIPVVFYSSADPVEAGLVASLSRPGGNLTGVSALTGQLVAKRIELIRELIPSATWIALLINPNSGSSPQQLKEANAAARSAGLGLLVLHATREQDFGPVFEAAINNRAAALIVGPDSFLSNSGPQLIALAATRRLPVVYQTMEFVEAGGLMSYGPSRLVAFRRVGAFVGHILQGSDPANMPVEQPTKLELAINLRTAHALGLKITDSIIVRADEVIE